MTDYEPPTVETYGSVEELTENGPPGEYGRPPGLE